MKGLLLATDDMGRPLDVIAVSDSRHALVLAAGQGKTLPVPPSATMMLVNATANVWVQYDGLAALPTTDDISGGAAPELNPGPRFIKGITAIGVCAAQACEVGVTFYQGGSL